MSEDVPAFEFGAMILPEVYIDIRQEYSYSDGICEMSSMLMIGLKMKEETVIILWVNSHK